MTVLTRFMSSSSATLVVDMENAPCRFDARMERPGDIAAGDTIALHVPPQRIDGAMA
jgi:hypothetical protein